MQKPLQELKEDENMIEEWVPKSTIQSQFSSTNKSHQEFVIDSWLLRKKGM